MMIKYFSKSTKCYSRSLENDQRVLNEFLGENPKAEDIIEYSLYKLNVNSKIKQINFEEFTDEQLFNKISEIEKDCNSKECKRKYNSSAKQIIINFSFLNIPYKEMINYIDSHNQNILEKINDNLNGYFKYSTAFHQIIYSFLGSFFLLVLSIVIIISEILPNIFEWINR